MPETYHNFGELYLKIVKPRIDNGEPLSNKLKIEPPAQSSTFVSFHWEGEIYHVKGDSSLKALQKAYEDYLEKGYKAFEIEEESTITIRALRILPHITSLYIYSKKLRKKVK